MVNAAEVGAPGEGGGLCISPLWASVFPSGGRRAEWERAWGEESERPGPESDDTTT